MSDEATRAATSPKSSSGTTPGVGVNSAATPARNPQLQQHLGLMLSGLLSLLLAVKVLDVGNYETETAMGIVQVAGTANVLVSSLVSVLPYLVVAGFFVSFDRWGHRVGSLTTGEKSALFSALALPSFVLVSVLPFVLLGLIVAFLGIMFALMRNRTRQSRKPKKWRKPKKAKAATSEGATESAPPRTESPLESAASRASVVTGALVMAVIAPWMPSEAVAVGHEEPVAAYVVGTREDETVFLPHGNEKGLIVAKTADVRREYCDSRSWASVTLFQLFRDAPYDACPK